MRLPVYQVDAFTREVFGGNPAAVCLLAEWLDESTMQAIAAENNLSETAFCLPGDEAFALRWFTPTTEVSLCGHATLATAHVLLRETAMAAGEVRFDTASGRLTVWEEDERLAMALPRRDGRDIPVPEGIGGALGAKAQSAQTGEDLLVELAGEDAVEAVSPDLDALARLDYRGVIVTAAGGDVDFVSRFFAPRVGVPEDPVTGSAHAMLAPFWAQRLGRDRLSARQLSARGGELDCRVQQDGVILAGYCATFLEGALRC